MRSSVALLEAAMRGDSDGIKSLLEAKASVNFQDKDGWSALHFAACASHPAALKSLLLGKADVNLKQQTGHTPLHIAITHIHSGHLSIYAKPFDCVNALLKAKADVNIQSNAGDYVLAFASYRGNHALVRRLLQAKANVNAEDHYGHTALSYAKQQGDPIQVKLLLKEGRKQSLSFPTEPKDFFSRFFKRISIEKKQSNGSKPTIPAKK